MYQPGPLQTDDWVPWAWGKGNSVWGMLDNAAHGKKETVDQLLNDSPSLVHCSYAYRNPLHFAVRENHIEIAESLLAKGSVVTYTGERWHASAPAIAKERGYSAVVELLRKHLEDSFGICEAGKSLAIAIRAHDQQQVERLLRQHGPDVADPLGNKPLHWCALTRHLDLAALCLEAGADIDARRSDGARAIDLTMGDYWFRSWNIPAELGASDQWEVVDFLLENNAEYDLVTATRRGDLSRVESIVSSDPTAANRSVPYCSWYIGFPLRNAAKAGHLEIVRYLLEHGADPNKAEHGLAPSGGSLFDATQNGHLDVVRMLLEHGADPNQTVESSGSPFSVASDPEIKELIEKHGGICDVFGSVYYDQADHLKTHCERHPHLANDPELFAMAASQGNRDCVDAMLRYQPDLWERMPATWSDSEETRNWMLECGMQVNQVDWLSRHSLHENASAERLEFWLREGVDLNLVESEHQSTPLGLATRRGDIDQVKSLIASGADTRLSGAEFAAPRNWANRGQHKELLQLLD